MELFVYSECLDMTDSWWSSLKTGNWVHWHTSWWNCCIWVLWHDSWLNCGIWVLWSDRQLTELWYFNVLTWQTADDIVVFEYFDITADGIHSVVSDCFDITDSWWNSLTVVFDCFDMTDSWLNSLTVVFECFDMTDSLWNSLTVVFECFDMTYSWWNCGIWVPWHDRQLMELWYLSSLTWQSADGIVVFECFDMTGKWCNYEFYGLLWHDSQLMKLDKF